MLRNISDSFRADSGLLSTNSFTNSSGVQFTLYFVVRTVPTRLVMSRFHVENVSD